jgi:hypothetical protein
MAAASRITRQGHDAIIGNSFASDSRQPLDVPNVLVPEAGPMNDHTLIKDDQVQNTLTECPVPKKIFISPLGWSIKGRLLWAALATALLWLAVAWAIGPLH